VSATCPGPTMNDTESTGAALLAQRLTALHSESLAVPPAAHDLVANSTPLETAEPDVPLPDYVAHALARWRLLHDVGFRYLVPDARLLPPESVRFFTLDEAWLDELVAGALSAGGFGSRERLQAARALPAALAAAQAHMPVVRDVRRQRLLLHSPELHAVVETAAEEAEPALTVTGLLLRSAAVTGWPAMQVRAWASDDPADVPLGVDPGELATSRPDLVVPVLRMELLSPSVLIALFGGIPRLVWVEEPHHSVQLGVEEDGPGWSLPVRDTTGHETGASIPVPLRPGPVAGVVDVAALASNLDQASPLASPRGSAGVALELLQAPSRQRFAASAAAADPLMTRPVPRRRR
jgi:hypothetical protein